MPEMVQTLADNAAGINLPTVIIGTLSLLFLFWVRKGFKPLLLRFGLHPRSADLLAKAGPVFAVAVAILAVVGLQLDRNGVAIVGAIPTGLPPILAPLLDVGMWQALLVPALLISIIGFVESVSVAQTLAAKRRQRIVRHACRDRRRDVQADADSAGVGHPGRQL